MRSAGLAASSSGTTPAKDDAGTRRGWWPVTGWLPGDGGERPFVSDEFRAHVRALLIAES